MDAADPQSYVECSTSMQLIGGGQKNKFQIMQLIPHHHLLLQQFQQSIPTPTETAWPSATRILNSATIANHASKGSYQLFITSGGLMGFS